MKIRRKGIVSQRACEQESWSYIAKYSSQLYVLTGKKRHWWNLLSSLKAKWFWASIRNDWRVKVITFLKAKVKKEEELKLIDHFGRANIIILRGGVTLIKIKRVASHWITVIIWRI